MVIIGSVNIGKTILAPLAGCSDLPFRLICREHGARLAFYEMIDCNSLLHHSRKTGELLQTTDTDQPIAAQLIGGDADDMARAAKILIGMIRPPFLDINAACPVKKMMKKGSGANLLREPLTLYSIVRKVAAAVDIPVTVKLRIGYDKKDHKRIAAIARNCEKNGAAALFVHGRTKSQLYSGDVDYGAIKAVKEAVTIPVFGSGNVFTPELAAKMLATGCDGVMVARGAFGNPWIFQQIEQYLDGQAAELPSLAERRAVLKQHLAYTLEYRGKYKNNLIGLMRKVAIWYLKSFPNAAAARGRVTEAKNYPELLETIDRFLT
ncbi:MAG: tRNA dihydrouridine synthase DusB [Candidatus Margulisbacteria bacterium]|nr:tRNA dihydrouridine synthase DusB [Candidatus Margulisiibacteriota bacterium]MBU1617207.1 tRNA dihydrouridine synthase DusB [Candidatus Margulisiibacteriota bacterium]MBU1867774.1 tRNA dihydrouridine synthase DusB [Candidatus Margulisiibacteriota bacterium]